MEKETIYCRENGHQWIWTYGGFWNTARCLTCKIVLRGINLMEKDLP